MGITAFFYWRTFSTLSRRRFALLLLLRCLTITVIVLVLFRPMLQYTKEQIQRKSVVFVVDTSASMSIEDGAGIAAGTENQEGGGIVTKKVRLEQVKEKIAMWSEQLEQDFLLHVVDFSDKATSHQNMNEYIGLKPDGTSTSLSEGLNGIAAVMDSKKIASEEIEAIFFFSDGQHNTVGNPIDTAKKLAERKSPNTVARSVADPEVSTQLKSLISINAIGVGTSLKSSSSFKDVLVTDIQVPECITVNNKTIITVGVEAVGLEGHTVKVILEEDTSMATEPTRGAMRDDDVTELMSGAPASRQIIEEKELVLDAFEGPQDVEFEFTPSKVGRTLYIGRVEPLSDEAIKENNERQTAALVVEPGMRVFYIEGTLRPEYGAITQRFLSKDPDLQFHAMVRTQSNMFQKRTNIDGFDLNGLPPDQETVDMFDVFILGDVDSSYLSPELQQMIVNRVENGAGLLMLGGYHSLGPGGYAGTPIGDILPVMLGDREIGQHTEPFLPKLTPEGVNSHIFANIADFFPTEIGTSRRAGLPALGGCTQVQMPRPAARVLATCPAVMVPSPGGGEVEMPVLAIQLVDKGRTVVFTGDTTRQWDQQLRALNQDSPFMQFWGQMVRYLAGREGAVVPEPSCSAAVDKAYYEPQDTVTITATVKNDSGEGEENATVTATVFLPDGQTDEVKLEPIHGAIGKYVGTYEPRMIGQQEVKVEAKVDGLPPLNAPEKMIIDVGRPNMEFDRLDLDEDLMMQIANASGGRYAHITTADFLIDQLNRDVMKRKEIVQISLAPPFMFWVMFVGLLTAEWTLRRRYHLR